MPITIAVSGKGGSGKTTLSGLLIHHLIKSNKTPILAVDADPNTNLDLTLEMKVNDVVADLREEVLEKKVPEGMSKTAFLELKLQECLVEGKGIDLLVMGRPEGPGCYCAVNNLLRTYLSKIASNYKYVIVDNEAGMEHLSRRTTNNVDVLFIVSPPTVIGIRSAGNIRKTSGQLKLKIKKTRLVVNQASKLNSGLLEEIEKNNLELAGTIPVDRSVLKVSEEGRSIFSLPEESEALKAVSDFVRSI
jgi:CO dehydrogenase maturation factor